MKNMGILIGVVILVFVLGGLVGYSLRGRFDDTGSDSSPAGQNEDEEIKKLVQSLDENTRKLLEMRTSPYFHKLTIQMDGRVSEMGDASIFFSSEEGKIKFPISNNKTDFLKTVPREGESSMGLEPVNARVIKPGVKVRVVAQLTENTFFANKIIIFQRDYQSEE